MTDDIRKFPLTLAGLTLGVVSAIVAALATGKTLVSGQSAIPDFFAKGRYEVDTGFVVFIGTVGVLVAMSIALPYLWARLAGIGLLAFLALSVILVVIAARANDDRFVRDTDVALESGGVLLVVASLIALGGLTLALVGARELGAQQYAVEAGAPPAPSPGSCGWAVASLVLGIAGFVTFFTGALAIAFAALAFADIRRTPARTGRGLAVAGLVLGLVVLSLYGLVLLLSAFFAGPS